MYKATRELIKARAPYVNGLPLKAVPCVRHVSVGSLNKCYTNSHAAKEAAALEGKRVGMVSGWIVQPYDAKLNVVGIIAHWWNIDADGNHFDTTPFVNEAGESIEHSSLIGEYVQDTALFKFCLDFDERLEEHLPCSLLYDNGRFSKLLDTETMLFQGLGELRTESLFNCIN